MKLPMKLMVKVTCEVTGDDDISGPGILHLPEPPPLSIAVPISGSRVVADFATGKYAGTIINVPRNFTNNSFYPAVTRTA